MHVHMFNAVVGLGEPCHIPIFQGSSYLEQLQLKRAVSSSPVLSQSTWDTPL